MGLILSWVAGCVDGRLNPVPLPAEPDGLESLGRGHAPPNLTADTPEAAPAPTTRREPGEELFAPGVIQDLELLLSDDAWDSLRDAPEVDVEGVLVWRGMEFRSGVRLKGTNSWRSLDQKASFKVDVHEYIDAQRIDGQKRLTLNNMVQDPTMLREHAYYWLAERLHVPGPRQAYTRLRVNGEPYGLYSLVETMDGQLLKRLYPEDPDGNLYEASGSDFTAARDWFDLEEDGGLVPAPDDIDALVEALEDAGGDGFDATITSRFDRDTLLAYLAMDAVAGNIDGYVFNHHNYYAYHLAWADRWVLLPWGTDRAFTQEVPPSGSAELPVLGVLAQRCRRDERCEADLDAAIGEVLDVWEGGGFRDEIVSAEALIHDDCEADPRAEYGCRPELLLDFVDGRVAFVRAAME